MDPFDYIAHETERQSGTVREALGMYRAWKYAAGMNDYNMRVNEGDLLNWAHLINGTTDYRKVPAVFNQGRPAIAAENIPNAMARLLKAINDPQIGLTPEHHTREFLEIHPFADGNGRVGSLLWNYLRGSIHSPEPMPYFFGENNA